MVSTKNQDTGIQLVNKLTSNTTERNQLWKDTPETRMSKNNNKELTRISFQVDNLRR